MKEDQKDKREERTVGSQEGCKKNDEKREGSYEADKMEEVAGKQKLLVGTFALDSLGTPTAKKTNKTRPCFCASYSRQPAILRYC